MHPPTPNYELVRPEETDPMNQPTVQINPNWDAITDAASPPSGVTLPQAGTYELGDRFYLTTTGSIYILVTQDANWGWHWRPIQDAISPWFTVPTTCMDIAGWTLNPVVSNPFAIAFDNRGKCYWRGIIGTSVGNISRNVSHAVFKPLPTGLRPRQRGAYMLGHETLAVGNNGDLTNSWQGARIFISDDETANATVRCFGGNADFNRVHLGGAVQYAVGTAKYTLV